MDTVASSSIDDRRLGVVFTVVNHDGPDVDEGEEEDIGPLLQREKEREEVVGNGLREAIDWVKGVGCVRAGHDPFVVRLVKSSVDGRMMETAVDPVYASIGEEDEEGKLQQVVVWERRLVRAVVELGVASHFGQHAQGGQGGHAWHCLHGLRNLEPYLILEELRVFNCVLVEDEDVGERGEGEI